MKMKQEYKDDMMIDICTAMRAKLRARTSEEREVWWTQQDIACELKASGGLAWQIICIGLTAGYFIARDGDMPKQKILVALHPKLR